MSEALKNEQIEAKSSRNNGGKVLEQYQKLDMLVTINSKPAKN